MNKISRIHAWLVDNGPATIAEIAEALGENQPYVSSTIYANPDKFETVATVEGKYRGLYRHLWHAKSSRTRRRKYQQVTIAGGHTLRAYYSRVNHVWLAVGGAVVWPVAWYED